MLYEKLKVSFSFFPPLPPLLSVIFLIFSFLLLDRHRDYELMEELEYLRRREYYDRRYEDMDRYYYDRERRDYGGDRYYPPYMGGGGGGDYSMDRERLRGGAAGGYSGGRYRNDYYDDYYDRGGGHYMGRGDPYPPRPYPPRRM